MSREYNVIQNNIEAEGSPICVHLNSLFFWRNTNHHLILGDPSINSLCLSAKEKKSRLSQQTRMLS